MKDNPYSKMIELMKKQGAASNPPSTQIGILISANPLIIKVNDLPIDKNNLLISDNLVLNNDDIGKQFAVIPVYDRQLYIILTKLKEVS